MSDLYQYDENHKGRKVFVFVVGHSDMVPKYKTYRGTDGKCHLLPEYGGNFDMLGGASFDIIPDKAEYHSPMDRTVVGGRAAHREHMKRHNVVEAGDMKLGHSQGIDRAPMTRAGVDIQRAIQELNR